MANIIRLTRAGTSEPVWVNMDTVHVIRAVDADETRGRCTYLDFSTTSFCAEYVEQTPEHIVKLTRESYGGGVG